MARSFFERLTGTLRMDEDHFEDEEVQIPIESTDDEYAEETEGELAVDVYETVDAIIVKVMTAGVRKEDLDITLTREMLTIRGSRLDQTESSSANYIHRELYWGSFSRTIFLPEEVDIDRAEAGEDHGLLTIKLPKIDKNRAASISVI